MRLTDGREQVCQLPARYPLPEGSDDALLLGKRTEWQPLGDGTHYAGLGLKPGSAKAMNSHCTACGS